ncbi:pimeloyl-ACP methyl ester carboxylesterase [Streptosporangium lutulentum]|uniref:Pimeloyl-ACP methyl ester carboxylesterase n=2 Tax=Streptosporangium lutulentum TaxID=1461250 RepID=A0ABT9QAV3_9ACTN|nr:pimeloyl-ACP methyl ester carboxylesterase [Streptosporangium lutulentum]
MDVLRAPLGDEKLTFLGVSYGTRLGGVCAEQFPENVRAMVFDGALDPRADATEQRLAIYVGFQRSFKQMAAFCDRGSDGVWSTLLDANFAINCMDEERRSPEEEAELRARIAELSPWPVGAEATRPAFSLTRRPPRGEPHDEIPPDPGLQKGKTHVRHPRRRLGPPRHATSGEHGGPGPAGALRVGTTVGPVRDNCV